MKHYCKNHQDKIALSFCHSCGEYYCKECLIESTEYYYCKKEFCITKMLDISEMKKITYEDGRNYFVSVKTGEGYSVEIDTIKPVKKKHEFNIKNFHAEKGWIIRTILSLIIVSIIIISLSYLIEWQILDACFLLSVFSLWLVFFSTAMTKGYIYYYCSKCHTKVSRDTKFCPRCKVLLLDDMIRKKELKEKLELESIGFLVKFIIFPIIVLSILSFILFPNLITNTGIYNHLKLGNALWIAYVLYSLGIGVIFFWIVTYIFRLDKERNITNES